MFDTVFFDLLFVQEGTDRYYMISTDTYMCFPVQQKKANDKTDRMFVSIYLPRPFAERVPVQEPSTYTGAIFSCVSIIPTWNETRLLARVVVRFPGFLASSATLMLTRLQS